MAQQNHQEVNGVGTRRACRDEVEQQCLQRLAEGDDNAFWALWQQYQEELLFRYSLSWMRGDYEAAEDALSAASIKAYKGWQASPDAITNVRGWLLRLLHNHCVDVSRARERHYRVIQLVDDIDCHGHVTNKHGSAEDMVSRAQVLSNILQAIDDLPVRLRAASRLRFVHEMPYRDIALQLSLSPENVRKRLQQARALLQPTLAKYKYK